MSMMPTINVIQGWWLLIMCPYMSVFPYSTPEILFQPKTFVTGVWTLVEEFDCRGTNPVVPKQSSFLWACLVLVQFILNNLPTFSLGVLKNLYHTVKAATCFKGG